MNRTREEAARRARAYRDDALFEPKRNPWPDVLVALVAIAIMAGAAVVWYARQPAPADYRADSPPAVVKPPAPLPTLQPAQREIIGAQESHAIRGALPTPAPAVENPAEFVAPVELSPAQPVPTIAPEQATVIGARTSNGCAAGQVFMPRVGCHTPGSAGAMPGPVGQP